MPHAAESCAERHAQEALGSVRLGEEAGRGRRKRRNEDKLDLGFSVTKTGTVLFF